MPHCVCVCVQGVHTLFLINEQLVCSRTQCPHSVLGDSSSGWEISTGNVITRVCQSPWRRSVNVLTSSVKADPDSVGIHQKWTPPGSLSDHVCLDHTRSLHTVAMEGTSQILTPLTTLLHFSLSGCLTLSLLFQLSPTSLFSPSPLWVSTKLSKTATCPSGSGWGADGLGIPDWWPFWRQRPITSFFRERDSSNSGTTFLNSFPNFPLLVSACCCFLFFLHFSYSLEKERLRSDSRMILS